MNLHQKQHDWQNSDKEGMTQQITVDMDLLAAQLHNENCRLSA
jgi:hypothetical protein